MIVEIIEYANNVTVEVRGVTLISINEHNIPPGIPESAYTGKGVILVGVAGGGFIALPPGSDGEYVRYNSSDPLGIESGLPSIDVQDTTNYALNGGFDFGESMMDPTTLTTIPDGGYGPDQWKSYRENADLQYRRVDGSGDGDLTSPYYGEYKKITNAGKVLLCQPLEYLNTLRFRGNSVGFQLKLKSNAERTVKIAIAELQTGGTADTIPAVVSAWNVDGTNPTLEANIALIGAAQSCSVTTIWQTFQFTGAFPSTSKNLLLLIWTDADMAVNDTLHLAEAGLYYGSTLRSWRPRLIGDELKLLQRYYYMHVKGSSKVICAGFAASASSVGGDIQFPVTMRITPTLDASSGTNYYNFYRSGALDAFNSLLLSIEHPNGGELYNSTEISSTAGHAGSIRTNNASAYVGFSARL